VDTGCSILLVLRQQETIDQMKSILATRGYNIAEVCTSGMQGLRLAALHTVDIAVVGFTLSDMPGMTFAQDLLSQHSCSVVMITPPEQINYVRQSAGTSDIVCLPRPVSPQSLLTAIDLVMQYRSRIQLLNQETQKLRMSLERRALAEKAKTVLMNKLQMGEAEAWRALQKQSMDTGRPLVEIAEEILEAYGKKH
jgi:AmiR/NasT family two-component response regulator